MSFCADRGRRPLRRRHTRLGLAFLRGRLEPLEERALLTAGIALDPTFGQGGLVKTDQLGISGDTATNIAITGPDGKILVAGDANQPDAGNHFLLARYNADGTLDTSFGDAGFVTTTLGSDWNAYGMAVDGSGHIVVVGDANLGQQEAAIVKYNADGSLDTAFGNGGIVTTGFGNAIATARGVAIDSAGNIDIAGDVFRSTQTSSGYQLLVARFLPDGSLDPSFGNGGATTSTVGTYGNAIAIDGSGRLVVAGQTGSYNSSQALVARFTSDGSLDTTLNNGAGYATTQFGTAAAFGTAIPAVANAVAIDANQHIVIAGDTANSQGKRDVIGLARYTAQGVPDTTFGYGGNVTTYDNGDTARGLAIDQAGNVLVAAQTRYTNFAALRFTPEGLPDNTFGTQGGGEVDVSFGSSYYANQASGVALTSSGQIVLAGQVNNGLNVNHLALARLNANGSIDSSFGTDQNGTVVSSFQTSVLNGARAMAIESDGKIVTAGGAWPSSGRLFSVSRYNEDGTLDTSFGTGGTVDTDMTSTYPKYDDYANAVAIDAQQRIVVAGQVDHPGGGMDIALARYEPNGALDTSFGSDGIVITSLIPYGNNSANAVAIDANGDILVGGVTSQPQSYGTSNFALLRYTDSGQLDATFGGTAYGGGPGWVQTDFSGGHDIAYAMALEPDGRIVLAGSAYQSNTGDDFALARYNTNGSLDTTFGGTGKVTTDFGPLGYTYATDDA